MVKAARKRKKEEDEGFELPEFDEVEYMRKEVLAAKASFAIIALAIALAVLLFAITIAGVPIVAFFLGLAITFLLPRVLRILPWPKVDTSRFERKDWIGHGGTFFFSWLAFWVLLLNMPIVDVTPPVIEGVTVGWNEENRTVNPYPGQNGPYNTGGATSLTFSARIQENGVLNGVQFIVYTGTFTNYTVPVHPGVLYSVTVPRTGNNYDVQVLATDAAGHVTVFRFAFTLNS